VRLPVTLEFKSSRTLGAALVLAHLAVAFGAVRTGLPVPVLLASCIFLVASLAFNLRRSVLRLPFVALTLRTDGLLEVRNREGNLGIAEVLPQTTVFPWLVVMLLRVEDREIALTLPPDSLEGEGHRLLRLWLRWKATAAAA
jgi:hypothetical protein